jgi:hypothetical protein
VRGSTHIIAHNAQQTVGLHRNLAVLLAGIKSTTIEQSSGRRPPSHGTSRYDDVIVYVIRHLKQRQSADPHDVVAPMYF